MSPPIVIGHWPHPSAQLGRNRPESAGISVRPGLRSDARGWLNHACLRVKEPEPTIRLPCRRSWVRVPSSAPRTTCKRACCVACEANPPTIVARLRVEMLPSSDNRRPHHARSTRVAGFFRTPRSGGCRRPMSDGAVYALDWPPGHHAAVSEKRAGTSVLTLVLARSSIAPYLSRGESEELVVGRSQHQRPRRAGLSVRTVPAAVYRPRGTPWRRYGR